MRNKVIWAGHMVRLDAGKLVKRVEEHQGCQKMGSEQLRWKDCVRRGTRRSGRMKDGEGVGDRKVWKETTERVTRQYFILP